MDERDVTGQMEETADEARTQAWETAHQAGAQTSDFAARAREQASAVKDHVTDTARHMAHEARERMAQGAHALRDRGEGVIDDGKTRAAEEVSHLSDAVRSAADRLREQHDDLIAGYVEAVAERLDGAAGYLRGRDLYGLYQDAQSFARRRPELVLGGMFLAGLALARLVKMAMPHDREAHDYYTGYEGENYGGQFNREVSPPASASYGLMSQMAGEPYAPSEEAGGLAGGLEHVDRPGSVGSLHAGTTPTQRPASSSTAADSDITRSTDITSGTKPGGPPSLQP